MGFLGNRSMQQCGQKNRLGLVIQRFGVLAVAASTALAVAAAKQAGTLARPAGSPDSLPSIANRAAKETVTVAVATRFATPCHILDSGLPGPVVMVVGGLNGDEPAGAWAADEIRHWPVTHGKIVLLPRANIPGLQAGTRLTPGAATAAGDLDRLFGSSAAGGSENDSPAAAIWQLAVDFKPNWLIELRETQNTDRHRAAPNVGGNGTPQAASAAEVVLRAVNATIAEPKKQFTPGPSPAMGSLARAAGEQLRSHSLVLQTSGDIEQPLALRIRQDRIMLHALLEHLDMITPATPVDLIVDGEEDLRTIRLAIFAGPGTRKGMHHLLQEMQRLPDSVVIPVGVEEINAGALRHCNVILFPGGSSTRQGASLGDIDRRQVRDFIQRGGGYVGICAGAFLATTEWPNSLKILDAKNYSTEWKRGRGVVRMELTPKGQEILGTSQICCDVRYHNGPLLVPAESPDLPEYQSLAVYRTEVSEYGPKGAMLGAPAIVAGEFGKGRVLCFSPHPDQTKGLEELVRRGVRWTAHSG
jgi:hypothetical protein